MCDPRCTVGYIKKKIAHDLILACLYCIGKKSYMENHCSTDNLRIQYVCTLCMFIQWRTTKERMPDVLCVDACMQLCNPMRMQARSPQRQKP